MGLNIEHFTVERAIVMVAVKAALDQGYTLDVIDGITSEGQRVLHKATSATAIEAALFSTDDDALVIRDAETGARLGAMEFIYGNGTDVLHDYSANIVTNGIANVVEAWIEELETHPERFRVTKVA